MRAKLPSAAAARVTGGTPGGSETHGMNDERDPELADDIETAQATDPQSGQSDDPRVDPTPQRSHDSTPPDRARTNALGIADPTA